MGNTRDTYTFALWGLSPLVDLLEWKLKVGTHVSLSWLFDDYPIHCVMYEILPGSFEQTSRTEVSTSMRMRAAARHLPAMAMAFLLSLRGLYRAEEQRTHLIL